MFAPLSLYKSDASSIATIDALNSSLSSITRIMIPLVVIGILLMGIAQLFRRHYGAAILALVVAGGVLAMYFLLPQLTSAFSESTSPSAKPTRTPTSTPTPKPTATTPDATTPTAQPIDMSWIWIGLGLIVAVIVCIAAICLAVWAIGAARARRRERLKQVAAERQVIERLTAKWQQIRDRHNELLRLYLGAETDSDSLFFTPALTDPTVPATGRMLQAMRDANTLRDTSGDLPANLTSETDLTKLPYPRAVDAFGLAWDAAVSNAQRLGQKGIPRPSGSSSRRSASC